MAERRDGLALLEADHRRHEALLAELEQRVEGTPREVLDELVEALSVHNAVELEALYPFVARHLDGGVGLAKRARLEHDEIAHLLVRLERGPSSSEAFRTELAGLVDEVRRHVRGEEALVFPALRARITPEELGGLADRIERARRLAPTRPHPSAPRSAWGARVANRLVGPVDRLRRARSRAS